MRITYKDGIRRVNPGVSTGQERGWGLMSPMERRRIEQTEQQGIMQRERGLDRTAGLQLGQMQHVTGPQGTERIKQAGLNTTMGTQMAGLNTVEGTRQTGAIDIAGKNLEGVKYGADATKAVGLGRNQAYVDVAGKTLEGTGLTQTAETERARLKADTDIAVKEIESLAEGARYSVQQAEAWRDTFERSVATLETEIGTLEQQLAEQKGLPDDKRNDTLADAYQNQLTTKRRKLQRVQGNLNKLPPRAGMPAGLAPEAAGGGQQGGEVARQTKDGRIAIYDAQTKKFLRYQE